MNVTKGHRRSGTDLSLDDFFRIISINGIDFYSLRDSNGLASSEIFDAARRSKILLPSLGHIVDFVNLDKNKNSLIIREYLKNNQLLTTTIINKSESNYYIYAQELDNELRPIRNIKNEGIRNMVFNKFGTWLNLKDIKSLTYPQYINGIETEKNLAEIIFNRPYDCITTALESISPESKQRIFLSDWMNDDPLTLLIHEESLIIYRHGICCDGKFCVLD